MMGSDPALVLAILLETLMFFATMRVIFCLAKAANNIALRLLFRWSE